MTRLRMFDGPFDPAGTPPPGPFTIPPLPRPHEAAHVYPDGVPAPGALAFDTGMPDEGSASGTLTTQPEYALPVALTFRTERHEAEAGYVSAYARETSARVGYECAWPPMTKTDADALTTKLLAARTVPVNWTPPGESAGAWRLVGVPVVEKLAGSVWRVRGTLAKVR